MQVPINDIPKDDVLKEDIPRDDVPEDAIAKDDYKAAVPGPDPQLPLIFVAHDLGGIVVKQVREYSFLASGL